MTGTKTAMTVGSLAFVILFGGGVFLMMNLGNIAKNIAEREASKALGVKVSIASIDVLIKEKKVVVKNVRVGNPAGYNGPHAATIQTITIKAKSLSDKLLHFQDVDVSGTNVYLEVKSDRTNLTDLKKKIAQRPKAKNATAEAIKVIVERLKLGGVTVHPKTTLVTEIALEPVKINAITIRGVGTKENGVLAKDAIGQIWAQLLPQIEKAAGGAGFYKGLSGDALKDLGLSQIKGVQDSIQNEINNVTDKIGKNLGGLFGN